MVGTVQMRDLQRVAERVGAARLALVGDRLHLRSVEARQPFRLLQDAGMETARMDDVLRQRSTDLKAAVTHMIAGDADLAVQSLGSDVREIPPDRLAETAARLWLALPPDVRRRSMILAPTHGQREEITAVLRKGLAGEEHLTGRTLEIERFRSHGIPPEHADSAFVRQPRESSAEAWESPVMSVFTKSTSTTATFISSRLGVPFYPTHVSTPDIFMPISDAAHEGHKCGFTRR